MMQAVQAPAGKGIMPGSFIDVLCQATHKSTGRPFTDIEIAQQVFTQPSLLQRLRSAEARAARADARIVVHGKVPVKGSSSEFLVALISWHMQAYNSVLGAQDTTSISIQLSMLLMTCRHS